MNLFEKIPAIFEKLATLSEVGLRYIKIGQSATTLSGGEAQRVKLAKELSKRSTRKTPYILDEVGQVLLCVVLLPSVRSSYSYLYSRSSYSYLYSS